MYTNATNVRTLVIAVAVAMLLLLGAGVAYATGGDSSAFQPTGSLNIDKAKSIALDQTNGGPRYGHRGRRTKRAIMRSRSSRDDGSQVDVHLDRDFNVLSTPQPITKGPTTKDGPNDDGG